MEMPNAKPEQTCCPTVELRQYTLHPGKRDVLIDLFDREFIELQEALGMKIIGQFRDVDNRNRFAWLRGFHDMSSRARALQEFYGGRVWKAHRDAANATMVDSDNVLLLHPASAASGFSLENKERPAPGSNEVRKELIVATIYYFDAPVSAGFVKYFEQMLKPIVTDAGASVVACFASEKMKTFLSGSHASTIQLHTNFTLPPWLDLNDGAASFPKNWRAVSNEHRKY